MQQHHLGDRLFKGDQSIVVQLAIHGMTLSVCQRGFKIRAEREDESDQLIFQMVIIDKDILTSGE
tara:strand:+ start:399 stop:593 length:195 start_codon:yes stop_codon:yes gene_type:complete